MDKLKQLMTQHLTYSLAIIFMIAGLAGFAEPVHAQDDPDKPEKLEKLQEMAPYRGYLKAHVKAQPQELLGGPLEISIQQNSGGVFTILPSKRELDPYVFGTTEIPRALAGTPGINGYYLPEHVASATGNTRK